MKPTNNRGGQDPQTVQTSPSAYLMILGSTEGLAYVLRERQMAFPPTSHVRLNMGDQVLLYTTRGAFRNPSRNRGRVIGTAEITSPVALLEPQPEIAGRVYTHGCKLKITGLAPVGEGVVLADMINRLNVFQPNPQTWSARMRRVLLTLEPPDAALISRQLKPILRDPQETVSPYLEIAARKAVGRARRLQR